MATTKKVSTDSSNQEVAMDAQAMTEATVAEYLAKSIYRPVEEVVAKLGDREFAAQYVVQVNKGSQQNPRWLDVIEWHTAIRMLDEVFGPFGYDLEIANSTNDYANGMFTVDIKLTGRALDKNGSVVSLSRPGRGLGLVPRSVMESGRNTDAEYDRQIHGAKSDAITNATKALGDGFGLYLYKKGNAQSQPRGAYPTTTVKDGVATGGQASYTASSPAPAASGANLGPRPSAGQMAVLAKHGYPAEFVNGLEFKDWKGIVNALLNKDEDGNYAPLAPAIPAPGHTGKVSQAQSQSQSHDSRSMGRKAVATAATADDEEPEDIPF